VKHIEKVIGTKAPGQSRAKKGGEIAPNGEFYEGGKFIATTDHAKRKKAVRRVGPARVEIEFRVWVDSRPGFIPLWGVLAGIEVPDRAKWTFSLNHSLRLHYAEPVAVAQRQRDIQAWNSGKRWRSTESNLCYE
jgi:hypothetical protein